MAWTTEAVRVRVPATSANLGPGFDTLGLALSLYDEVDAWVGDSGLSIEISGEGADLAGAGEDHLIVRAMRAAFAVIGDQPPGLVRAECPQAGLGRVQQVKGGIVQHGAQRPADRADVAAGRDLGG